MQRNKNNDEAAKGFDTKFVVATALKLLLISAVTALLLSGVNALTKDTIAENDAKEKSAAKISPAAADTSMMSRTFQ